MKSISVKAADGFSLGATVFQPPQAPRAVVLISPATGMRQNYYRRFAEFLLSAGYAVVTFDYRGLGASIHAGGIRSFRAHMRDWGQLDIPALCDWLEREYAGLPKYYVGHSFGGVGLGMSPQCQIFESLVLVSPPHFYYQNGGWAWRWRLAFLSQVYIPFSEKVLGYFGGRYVGLGDDLPSGIMSEWSRWVYHPDYIASTTQALYFDLISAPLLAFSFTDDELATNYRFFQQMLAFYTQAEIQHYHFDPSTFGIKHLGHNGFFRAYFPLWDEILIWWGDSPPRS